MHHELMKSSTDARKGMATALSLNAAFARCCRHHKERSRQARSTWRIV